MANMSNYLEEKVLRALFKGEFYAPPGIFIALLTVVPDDSADGTSITEPSAEDGYTRQEAPPDKWASPQDGIIKNNNDIKWEDVEWSDTIRAVAICEALQGGYILFWGELASPKQISVGDSVTFRPEALSIEIDN